MKQIAQIFLGGESPTLNFSKIWICKSHHPSETIHLVRTQNFLKN